MVRIWIEGCFDLYHPGHVFAFFMAKLLGDYLTAGLRPSNILEIHKRKPILNDDERYAMLEGCKYIDTTIISYFSVKEMMENENGKHINELFDFVAHGNDPIVCWNGVDCYQVAKEKLMYKEFKRISSFSTTNLIKRIILRNSRIFEENDYFEKIDEEILENEDCRNFLLQTYLQNKESKRVIYISGTFDLFHAGHLSILKYAKENDFYVIVGLKKEGFHITKFPIIMSFLERKLCLLSCKYINLIIEEGEVLNDVFFEKYNIKYLLRKKDSINFDDLNLKQMGLTLLEFSGQFDYLSSKLIQTRIITNKEYYLQKTN